MRRLSLILLALAACLAPTAALASPGAVLRDFRDDGQLSEDYTSSDTQAALARLDGAERQALSNAILARYDVALLGRRPRSAPPPPEASPPRVENERNGVKQSNEIPSVDDLIPTPLREPATGLPILVSVLGGLAAGLLIAGAASGIALRRLRRSR